MSSPNEQPTADSDLDRHDEIAEFVRRFYRDMSQDERFHEYFNVIAAVDWQAHTADLTDFWSSILLDGHLDRSADDVISGHAWLHERDPFDAELFRRWLEIFELTLDGGWSGPQTELARHRARGFVGAMSKRFLGASVRTFDVDESSGPANP